MTDDDSAPSLSGHPAGRRAPWLARVVTGARADIRQAMRQFRKSPGLAAATLATLALCIGSTTAIFSLVYSLLLKPLPFPEPERMVEVYNTAVKGGLDKLPSNVVQYLEYSKNGKSYEGLGLWTVSESMFGEDGAADRLSGAHATAEIFSLLRLQPVLGQFFTKDNNRPAEDKVAVLTQSFWEKQFAEDPAVIGKTIRVDGENLKIIGVAPRVLEAFDARVRFIQPLSWQPDAERWFMRYSLGIQMFGRLKPGVTIGQACAEAEIFEKRFYDATPDFRQFMDRSGIKVVVGGVQAERVQPVQATLFLLQGGVAFVLLIGCVNVANLLLVRANARQSEMAIRFALGAGRVVIARQLLVESLVLTGLGAMLGVILAAGALRAVNYYLAELLPQAPPMVLDGRVLGFALVLTLGVGIFIGLVPVFHLLRTNLAEIIQRNSRSMSSGRGVRTLSSVLVVTQVAVALMLLTGAGLLVDAFVHALNVDPGLDPKNVVMARVALPAAHRGSDQTATQIQDRLLQALEEIPGVSAAALSYSTPFRGGVGIGALTLAEDPLPPGSPQPGAFSVQVTPGYRETMRLRLVEGRFFESADRAAGTRRFVVDESFARKFFPGRSAIGGRFSFGGPPDKGAAWPTIIGVVRDVPHNGVEDRTGNPFVYELPRGRPGGLTLFVRTERPVADTIALIREKVRGIDPAIPLFDAGSLGEAIGSSFDKRRAVMLLLAAFAGLALFLSALGIYGVLAYDVSQRTREIGIRGAIGATRGRVVGMILRQGLEKAALGLVVGLAGAGLLSRYLTSLLFEVKPTDPLVYAGVSVLLLLVVALASYLPARRAARIDPLEALRAE